MSEYSLSDRDDARTSPEEQQISRAIAIGLPVVTVIASVVVCLMYGWATSILALAGGLLLGVIALFWGSLRILSGDAALSPELEALDMAAHGVDALAGRKKMLLRALKDLDNERAIGKLEEEDFEQLSSTYREELKVVLRRIDESLAPHRARAEEAIRAHFVSVGLTEGGYRGATPAEATEPESEAVSTEAPKTKAAKGAVGWRIACPKCGESNERDAKFCKECATSLAKPSTETTATAGKTEDSDDE